jgi:hypothetical protein
MAAPLPGDKSAGYTGLVVGALALLLILGGIVKAVNAKYAREAPAAAAQP